MYKASCSFPALLVFGAQKAGTTWLHKDILSPSILSLWKLMVPICVAPLIHSEIIIFQRTTLLRKSMHNTNELLTKNTVPARNLCLALFPGSAGVAGTRSFDSSTIYQFSRVKTTWIFSLPKAGSLKSLIGWHWHVASSCM